MCVHACTGVWVRARMGACAGARVCTEGRRRVHTQGCVCGCVCTRVRTQLACARGLCVFVHTCARARGPCASLRFRVGARVGVGRFPSACAHAGVRACARTCVLVLCSTGVWVPACAEVLVCAVGACLCGVHSPVRVRTACPRQPELIIVVVTASPLIPRIPLPPARRGLQINKSSLGAGASQHTYVPARRQHGDFRPPVGAAGEQAQHRAPEGPDLVAPALAPQCCWAPLGARLPPARSGPCMARGCGTDGRVRTIPSAGSSGRVTGPSLGDRSDPYGWKMMQGDNFGTRILGLQIKYQDAGVWVQCWPSITSTVLQ